MVAPLAVGLWTIAGLALVATAWYARSYRGEPGGDAFAALSGVLGLTALGFAATALDRNAILPAGTVLYCVVPLLWALFVFEYTGRFDVGTRRRRVLLTFPVAFLVASNFWFAAMAAVRFGVAPAEYQWTMAAEIVDSLSGFAAATMRAIQVGQTLGNFYVWGLAMMASAVFVAQSVRYEHVGGRVGGALALAAIGPWLVEMLGYTITSVPGTQTAATNVPLSIAFLVSAVAFPLALTRAELFDATPAAGTLGPERVLADMTEPVLVVDHDERVVRANPAARETFDAGGVVGRELSAVLGHGVASLRSAESLELSASEGHRRFEPSVSRMADAHGRDLGHAVVLRDVTGQRIRRQRLQVLNRVLRHNLRNDLTTIRGRAELLTDGTADVAEISDAITDSAEDLVEMGERAREIERMLSAPSTPNRRCDLGGVVDEVVADVRETHRADVDVAVPDDVVVAVDERVLAPVIRHLVENAVVHNDADRPWVRVSVDRGDGPLPVHLVVQDDGPGIPENERIALESGEEGPLDHGSSLGLWAVKWGVTKAGGRLSFADNEPRGTVVEVDLPAAAGAARADGEETGVVETS